MSRSLIPAALMLVSGLLFCGLVKADPPIITTPTAEHFNGISYAPDGSFGVAVGNAGIIMHFDANHPAGLVVASDTTDDIYDIDVLGDDFAVASTIGALLIWDGVTWTRYARASATAPFRPVWATPERDLVLFNEDYGNAPTDYRSAFDPTGLVYVPGSFSGPLDLTFCGHSGNIATINKDGDIEVIDNSRATVQVGGMPLLLEATMPQSLTSAWLSPSNCLPAAQLPNTAYAVRNNNDIMFFSGVTWALLQDIPDNEIITWIDGTADDHVVAVGYKDSVTNPGSNQGVIWECEAGSCLDVTNSLFPGSEIPGLTDIDMVYTHQSCVHVGGFEDNDTAAANNCVQPAPACAVVGSPGDCMTARVAAEDGKVIALDKALTPDLRIDVFAGVQFGLADDDFLIRVGNDGPDDAQDVSILVSTDLTPDAGCGFSGSEDFWILTLPTLTAGDLLTCTFTGVSSIPYVYVATIAQRGTDRDYSNNAIGCNVADHNCLSRDPRDGQ